MVLWRVDERHTPRHSVIPRPALPNVIKVTSFPPDIPPIKTFEAESRDEASETLYLRRLKMRNNWLVDLLQISEIISAVAASQREKTCRNLELSSVT